MATDAQQEQKVSEAFSRQSTSFDRIYDNNPITVWMRDKARAEALKYLQPSAHILELNCGTGTDSIFFAQRGYKVLATDNATGMLSQLANKVQQLGLQERISVRQCSFNDLGALGNEQYDYLFSNFSGLNCADDLPKVLKDADALLKPGGYFTFVIMPKVCPWEIVTLLNGRKKALRRFNKNGASAHIEGVYFTCWYYNSSVVKIAMGNGYKLCSLKGLASIVPPPSMEYFPAKYPRLFAAFKKMENTVCNIFPFNRWCDQYVITMQKVK